MIILKRTKSNNIHFGELINQLDNDLNDRYGKEQEKYNEYNTIEFINTVFIAYSDDLPVGCGCYKKIKEDTVEIKRMYVIPEYTGDKGYQN